MNGCGWENLLLKPFENTLEQGGEHGEKVGVNGRGWKTGKGVV